MIVGIAALAVGRIAECKASSKRGLSRPLVDGLKSDRYPLLGTTQNNGLVEWASLLGRFAVIGGWAGTLCCMQSTLLKVSALLALPVAASVIGEGAHRLRKRVVTPGVTRINDALVRAVLPLTLAIALIVQGGRLRSLGTLAAGLGCLATLRLRPKERVQENKKQFLALKNVIANRAKTREEAWGEAQTLGKPFRESIYRDEIDVLARHWMMERQVDDALEKLGDFAEKMDRFEEMVQGWNGFGGEGVAQLIAAIAGYTAWRHKDLSWELRRETEEPKALFDEYFADRPDEVVHPVFQERERIANRQAALITRLESWDGLFLQLFHRAKPHIAAFDEQLFNAQIQRSSIPKIPFRNSLDGAFDHVAQEPDWQAPLAAVQRWVADLRDVKDLQPKYLMIELLERRITGLQDAPSAQRLGQRISQLERKSLLTGVCASRLQRRLEQKMDAIQHSHGGDR